MGLTVSSSHCNSTVTTCSTSAIADLHQILDSTALDDNQVESVTTITVVMSNVPSSVVLSPPPPPPLAPLPLLLLVNTSVPSMPPPSTPPAPPHSPLPWPSANTSVLSMPPSSTPPAIPPSGSTRRRLLSEAVRTRSSEEEAVSNAARPSLTGGVRRSVRALAGSDSCRDITVDITATASSVSAIGSAVQAVALEMQATTQYVLQVANATFCECSPCVEVGTYSIDITTNITANADEATQVTNNAAEAGATVTIVSPPSERCIDGKAPGDESGMSISLSGTGTRVAVGAPGNDGGANAGYARVFDSTDGITWAQVGADIEGEAAGDHSGRSVALSADGLRLAVGAPGSDGGGEDAGQVRVFEWLGSNWVQIGTNVDGEAAGDESGGAVALDSVGSRLAVGASKNGGGGADAGHVRVYEWSGTSWEQMGADIDGETAGDWSGHEAVSLSGNGTRLAVGARYNSGGGYQAGHARVWEWSGLGWTQMGADIDGKAADEQSGWSVSLSADGAHLATGTAYNHSVGADGGYARVYKWSGSSWEQVGSDLSGCAVSLNADGSRLAVGACGQGNFTGHVQVYEWGDSRWNQVGSNINGEAAQDGSGRVVMLNADGKALAVGAHGNDGGGKSAGHVCVYSSEQLIPSPPPPYGLRPFTKRGGGISEF